MTAATREAKFVVQSRMSGLDKWAPRSERMDTSSEATELMRQLEAAREHPVEQFRVRVVIVTKKS